MNDPTRPLSSDIVDELLSADIDGEFDRAASELGFTTAGARAALDATPGTALRRAALLQARDRIARRPDLSPADELRIVGAALDQTTPELRVPIAPAVPRNKRRFENGWRVLVAAGSAAAVIAAIVAVGANRPGSESKSSTALTIGGNAPSPAANSTANPPAVEFGDVSAPATLRAEVQTRLRAAAYATGAARSTEKSADSVDGSLVPANAPKAPRPKRSTGTPSGSGPELFANGQTPVNQREALHSAVARSLCIAAGARAAHTAAAPALTGTGTYAGKPVVVAVFRQGGGHSVFVLSSPGCAIVAQQTLP